jgi:glycosyltransferase involved in cell wall biosynthesis
MNVIAVIPPKPIRRKQPAPRLRVLVASHSHPQVTRGGSEIAAFRLFTELNTRDDVEAWFLGCNTQPGSGRDGVALTQPYTDREYVYSTHGGFDWFRIANADPRLPGEFEALLLDLKPDIVHLHHYVVFGMEMLWTIKRVLPAARIIVTLHEYLAICHHFGQMVKSEHFSLCYKASLEDCHECFPGIAVSDFFIRDRYLRLFFQYVDHFISPSHFLKDRYAAWGIDPGTISVIENIIAPADSLPDTPADPNGADGPLRIGFFGQTSRLKGIGVLIECAGILSKNPAARILFEIYGDYNGQPKEFQDEFKKQLAVLDSNVIYRGAYRQDQVDRLMRGMDAVLVPSVWWENSPVVIQEALRNNRPVICSDVGGMAEKVRNGVDGFHFSIGSGLDLSNLLLRLHDDRTTLMKVRRTLKPPARAWDTVAEHLTLYNQAVLGKSDVVRPR